MGTFKIKSDGYFNSELAQIVGLENSIFIQDIAYWLDHNKSSGSAFEDGRYWSYSTLSAICERHPYWTKRQVERIIKNCRENGWIIVSNFNKSKYDRTNWYSLGDKILEFIGIDKEGNQLHELENSISPNREISFHQTVTPIQDIYNKDNLKNIFNTTPYNPPKVNGIFELYAGEDYDLLNVLYDYEKMRNRIKCPLTDRSKKILCNKLDEIHKQTGDNKIKLIEEAIIHSWKSVYPINGNQNHAGRGCKEIDKDIYDPHKYDNDTDIFGR